VPDPSRLQRTGGTLACWLEHPRAVDAADRFASGHGERHVDDRVRQYECRKRSRPADRQGPVGEDRRVHSAVEVDERRALRGSPRRARHRPRAPIGSRGCATRRTPGGRRGRCAAAPRSCTAPRHRVEDVLRPLESGDGDESVLHLDASHGRPAAPGGRVHAIFPQLRFRHRAVVTVQRHEPRGGWCRGSRGLVAS
jgi:hypothetical protein